MSMPQGTTFSIGWGTLALINAGLAQGKGRSGLLWFVVSLLLRPLATLLIVALPPEAASPQPTDQRLTAVLVAVIVIALIAYVLLIPLGLVTVHGTVAPSP